MANEAVIIELINSGEAIQYTCLDAVGITKGTLLALDDPRTVSGANIGNLNRAFAGIAAMDKVASDGSTTIGVYTKGVFDLYADGAVVVGTLVGMSGANRVTPLTAAISGAYLGVVVGKALETATKDETIAVKLGGF
jgi:hypothetical protein